MLFKFPTRGERLRAASDGTSALHRQVDGSEIAQWRYSHNGAGFHSLERQDLGVLVRMGLQLISLVEVLSTTPAVTLQGA